ncbi:MAG: biotin--[acetyl-CoA-carboxylase] ligase [Planctomycetes bacterium]|nr:biotin--[acetyl-CoA-carboxylase] ligase [Planctomycetota bacterium]
MTELLDQGAFLAARAWCAEAPVEVHEELPSTNDRLAQLAEEGAPEGTLVVAGSQTAGRGRHGRSWSSPEGGLYFSFLLRPDEAMLRRLAPTLVGGLAVCQALDGFTPEETRPQLKWPNDVLLDGRKVAGVLGEMTRGSDGYRLVLGLGINLAAVEFPDDVSEIATSVAATGACPEPTAFLAAFFESFTGLYRSVERGGGALILAQASARMPSLGKPIRLHLANESVTGIFSGLSATGGLVLESEDGTQRNVHLAGEVEAVRPR